MLKPKELRFRLYRNDLKLLTRQDRWRKQAELLSLSKRSKQKLEWFIYYHTKGSRQASKTVRYFGISRAVFYKWLAVFDPTNLKALEAGSTAPISRRSSELTESQEERILDLRKANPEYGKMKIKALYSRIYPEEISSWKVQLVIEKYHLQRNSKKSNRQFKKNSISKRRTVALQKQQQPGFLVAFDSIELRRNGITRYIVTGIDTVSKVAWARMYSTHSSVTTKDLFIRLYAITHGNILNACHDNGSEFEKHFAEHLASLKIPQYFSRVHTPKDNPICERFNGTLKREFLRQGNWTTDMAEFNKRLNRWLLKYNYYRPHQSLNYLTPFQYHFNQVKEEGLVHDVSV